MGATTPPPRIRDHWLAGARRRCSPHFDERPPGADIELIVVHCISLPKGAFGTGFVDALFLGTLDCTAHPSFADLAGVRVSSHLLIDRSGAITQYVPFDRRAWHAGVSSWCGRDGCNDYSVGIELEGCVEQAYTDAQYAALGGVIDALRHAYPALAADAVAGHCDIAPGRKTDPGPQFDWARIGLPRVRDPVADPARPRAARGGSGT